MKKIQRISQGVQNSQILRKKSTVGGITLPYFKTSTQL
jgi:hypothetical protein